MGKIVITKPNGQGTYELLSKEGVNVTSARQRVALLSEDVLSISLKSSVELPIGIGDYTTVFGRRYTINRLPEPSIVSEKISTYAIEMEGVQYDLLRATYDLTIDTTNNQLQDVQADSLTGGLKRFATVLIANANRVFPGRWVLGTCPTTEVKDKTLTFGEEANCLSVIQQLCSEFNTEFEISQEDGVNSLHFKKVGSPYPFTFQYGRGKGLYKLSRKNQSSANIITRLKVYGASKNITSKYRASRLCLPGKSKGQSYIEKPEIVAKYGIWEATKRFEEVFPSRTGKVTALGDQVFKFVDVKMFDLNEKAADGKTTKYLLPGVGAKIHFNSGNLAGYEFGLAKYDHSTHTFTLNALKDDRGEVFPSTSSPAFQFGIGDEYKILNVALPKSYEDAAEDKLAQKGGEYYKQNSQPKVQYDLAVTKNFLEGLVEEGETTNVFMPGDYIAVKDSRIGVDKSIRIKSIERDLLDIYNYKLTLSDMPVTTSLSAHVVAELQKVNKIIRFNKLHDPIRARQNWRTAQETLDLIFDPEGNYYTEKIKPNSVETLMLSAGAKSMQFGLLNTIINANYQGHKNSVYVQGGNLVHYAISDEIKSWNLATGTTSLSTDTKAYYIYAKCAKNAEAGIIIFSEKQIKVEEKDGYYHFWVGVVNSVDATLQARAVSLSYGFSTINGGFITTGCVKSRNKALLIDLDNARVVARKGAEIIGKITFTSGSSDIDLATWAGDTEVSVQKVDKKAQDALIAAQQNVADYNAKIAAVQQQLDGEVSNWFYSYSPSLTNAPASLWTTAVEKDRHIGDTFTNTQPVPAADAGKSWRFVKNDSTYSWVQIADNDAVLALQKAAKAQSTADGKSTTYLTQPASYKEGDAWVLNSDRTINGVAYKQGEILTATQDSSVFNEGHWLKRVRYTDDTAVNNLQISSKNLAVNTYVSGVRKKAGYLTIQLSEILEKGKRYTVGFSVEFIKDTGFLTALAYFDAETGNNALGSGFNYIESAGNKRYSVTLNITNSSRNILLYPQKNWASEASPSAGEVIFSNVAVYKGDKDLGALLSDSEKATERKKEIEKAKQEALNAVDTVANSVAALDTEIKGAFKDSIVTDAEKKVLSEKINVVSSQRANIIASYTKIYINENLQGSAKSSLLNTKTAFSGKVDILLSTINTVITDSTITPTERTRVKNDFKEYNAAYTALRKALEVASAAIQEKIKEEAETKAKALADAINPTSLAPGLKHWNLHSQSLKTIDDGKEGNTVLELSNIKSYPNAGKHIAIDLQREYKVRFWARAVDNCDGFLYFALRQFKNKKGTYCGKNGGRLPYKPSRSAPHADWRLYEYIWEKKDWQAGMKYVLPEFLNNFEGSKGAWQIQGFWISDVTDIRKNEAKTSEAKQIGINAQLAAKAAQQSNKNLKDYVDGAFEDSVLTAAEKKSIEKYKNTLNETMSKAEASYLKVYTNTYLKGLAKTNLSNAKINLWGQRDALVTAINTALSSTTTAANIVARKTLIDSAFTVFNSKMKAFQVAIEDANRAIQDTLKTEAEEKVNNLQIRSKNLAVNTYSMGHTQKGGYLKLQLSEILEKGKRYTVGFDAKLVTDKGFLTLLAYYDAITGSSVVGSVTTYISTEGHKRYSVTLNITNSSRNILLYPQKSWAHATSEKAGEVIFSNVAVYEGDKDLGALLSDSEKATERKKELEKLRKELDPTRQQADYLARALKKSTEVNGGLVLGSVIAVRDDSGKVSAYFSGNRAINKAAFKAGVEHFGTLGETHNTALNHDGTADLGDLRVERSGAVRIYDLTTHEERFGIIKQNIQSLPELQSASTFSLSDTGDAAYLNSTGGKAVPNLSLSVPKAGGKLDLQGEVSLNVRWHPLPSPPGSPNDPGVDSNALVRVEVSIELYKNGVSQGSVWEHTGITPAGGDSIVKSESVRASITADKGVYTAKIKATVFHNPGISDVDISFSSPKFSWKLEAQNYRKINFGLNGFFATYPDKLFYFSEEEGLVINGPVKMRGDIDIPPIVAGATVSAYGNVKNKIGTKTEDNVVHTPPGKYRVYHAIGHKNYNVDLTGSVFMYNGRPIPLLVGYYNVNAYYFDVVLTTDNGKPRDGEFTYALLSKE